MAQPLEIRVLGPFEVLVGGEPADVGGSKRQALLAMLALRNGRVVDVDALVDGLWGEELPAAPRNALHHHIARLRAALGEDAIVGSPDGYALSDARLDAARFEELLAETRAALREGDLFAALDAVEEGLALWRGAALQGLGGTTWFGAEARRLETLRVDALEEQFEVRLALGEHRELVSELRAALADNPYRERLWAQLMLAFYRGGRQADALEAFQEARRVLGEELGLEPGPDLRRLQDAILAQDPAIAAVPVDRRRGNLPAPSTSFVGREEDVRLVAAGVREHRLVTLVGPPGVGKSRLAVETARSLGDDCPDGIWFVELSRADSADDAVRLLANVVDVRDADPLARVAARLRDARSLLLLDACEHVLEEAARIASAILAECPGVRILATSREALHVPGEARTPVTPLEGAAVDLFLERARAARPGFGADEEEVALAEEIVRRVDGLPLAIELAAARTNVLGLAEIVSMLRHREVLLHDAPTFDPSRTALRELVEWSYDLLHGDEKTLVQQVAVHRGGASLASLVAIAATQGLDGATVAHLVGALVDKSIVSASFSGGTARYDLLDTVREYVLDRLAESSGLVTTRAAHAEYYAALADEARVELRGRGWLGWERRLQAENDNFWAALAYAREEDDAGVAARLGTLGWHFGLAERVSEGRRFLEVALAVMSEYPARAARIELEAVLCYLATEELNSTVALAVGEHALALAGGDASPELGLAQLAYARALAQAGRAEESDSLACDALGTLESFGDSWGSAAAGIIRATGAAARGDVGTVAEMVGVVRRHADAIDYDPFRVPGLLLEAWVAERGGDAAAAAEAYLRGLELAGAIGFGGHAAFAGARLGSLALESGDPKEAEALQRQALATAEAADAVWAAAYARIQLARIAATAGDAPAAARIYRQVLDWSQTEQPHEGRESLFLALCGNPVTAAELGLAELGETALM